VCRHDGPRLPESQDPICLIYLSVCLSIIHLSLDLQINLWSNIYLSAEFGMEPWIPGVEGPHGGAPVGPLPCLLTLYVSGLLANR
jgi:hypothetical protein